MLIYLGFNSYIISYNIFTYVMYITPHLHVVKGFWKFEILKHFEFLQISKFLTFYFVCFLSVGSRLLSSK
jgi:hypothetical protein